MFICLSDQDYYIFSVCQSRSLLVCQILRSCGRNYPVKAENTHFIFMKQVETNYNFRWWIKQQCTSHRKACFTTGKQILRGYLWPYIGLQCPRQIQYWKGNICFCSFFCLFWTFVRNFWRSLKSAMLDLKRHFFSRKITYDHILVYSVLDRYNFEREMYVFWYNFERKWYMILSIISKPNP